MGVLGGGVKAPISTAGSLRATGQRPPWPPRVPIRAATGAFAFSYFVLWAIAKIVEGSTRADLDQGINNHGVAYR